MAEKRKHCKVCDHKRVAHINSELRNNASLASLSKKYNISRATLKKHKEVCLAQNIVEDKAATELIHNSDSPLVKEIQNELEKMHKLVDACDDYLTDPDDPGRYYLGPRSEEIEVVYRDIDSKTGRQSQVMKKADLQVLLEMVTKDGRFYIINTKSTYADPRKLLLEVVGRMESMVKLISESHDKAEKAERERIKWEKEKALLEKAGKSGASEISFEKELAILTEKVTVAIRDSNTEELSQLAELPPIK